MLSPAPWALALLIAFQGMQDLLLSEQGWGRQDFRAQDSVLKVTSKSGTKVKFIRHSEAQLRFHKEFFTSVAWFFGLISQFELCIG